MRNTETKPILGTVFPTTDSPIYVEHSSAAMPVYEHSSNYNDYVTMSNYNDYAMHHAQGPSEIREGTWETCHCVVPFEIPIENYLEVVARKRKTIEMWSDSEEDILNAGSSENQNTKKQKFGHLEESLQCETMNTDFPRHESLQIVPEKIKRQSKPEFQDVVEVMLNEASQNIDGSSCLLEDIAEVKIQNTDRRISEIEKLERIGGENLMYSSDSEFESSSDSEFESGRDSEHETSSDDECEPINKRRYIEKWLVSIEENQDNVKDIFDGESLLEDVSQSVKTTKCRRNKQKTKELAGSSQEMEIITIESESDGDDASVIVDEVIVKPVCLPSRSRFVDLTSSCSEDDQPMIVEEIINCKKNNHLETVVKLNSEAGTKIQTGNRVAGENGAPKNDYGSFETDEFASGTRWYDMPKLPIYTYEEARALAGV